MDSSSSSFFSFSILPDEILVNILLSIKDPLTYYSFALTETVIGRISLDKLIVNQLKHRFLLSRSSVEEIYDDPHDRNDRNRVYILLRKEWTELFNKKKHGIEKRFLFWYYSSREASINPITSPSSFPSTATTTPLYLVPYSNSSKKALSVIARLEDLKDNTEERESSTPEEQNPLNPYPLINSSTPPNPHIFLLSELNWRDGFQDGEEISYYTNGKVRYIIPWVKGKEYGIMKGYHPNGQIHYSIPLNDGKEDGIEESWNEDGSLIYTKHWKDGKIINTIIY